jgi:uncharacterized protein YggE
MRIPPLVRVIIVFAAVIGIAAVVFYWVQSLQPDEETLPPISIANSVVTGDREQTGITVRGRGEVRATPDTAFITVGVETVAPTAAEASTELGLIATEVIAAIRETGVDEDDILTRSLTLSPIYERSEDGAVRPKITGYRASTTVVATVRDIDRASAVLDASLAAGANVFESVRFGVADDDSLRRQALEDAVENAARKADAMAVSLGGKIGGLIWIMEESQFSPNERALSTGISIAQSVPVQAGETIITTTVVANFSYE